MVIKTDSLTPGLLQILHQKGTEPPFSGEYNHSERPGTYLCRQCGLALFRSQSKFQSACGWPSFDQEVAGAVLYMPEGDGKRTEILCARCQGHLGHVFKGEQYTALNLRHCVNSLSLDFVPELEIQDTEEAIFAAGCFWGVEYFFQKLPGVLKVEAGYTGGDLLNPTYEQVCTGRTGHIEAVRVIFDPLKLTYETLTQYFFEIHDPTQKNGQGPDIGEQYVSALFFYDELQKSVATSLIGKLAHKGIMVATVLKPVNVFWPAEAYHQQYYLKTGKTPYCHRYHKLF